MAINYTVSYTFSPNTVISSSQVNTNFSDNSNTWTGLEALTKTFAKLKVDVDPSTALEVATKQYVDHYSAYRRPVLQYSSGTVVNMETGINGTSGQAQILFPDGNLRTDSTTTRINCNLAQVAALSGTAQSGLRTGSQTANTWYAIYAVKTSDNASNFVSVADTVLPLQANYATLNSNFGTSSWVYLGMIRNGDNNASTTVVLAFIQHGNRTLLRNSGSSGGRAFNLSGTVLATSASATSINYALSSGTGTTQIPNHLGIVQLTMGARASASANVTITDSNQVFDYGRSDGKTFVIQTWVSAVDGLQVTPGAAAILDACLTGWIDPVLGVGSNPIL